jgi:hypothetical protein
MTELPQTPPESQTTLSPKQHPIIPFDAHITFATPLRIVPGGMELHLGGHPVTVELHPSIVLKVQETPPEPERIYKVLLWFRTKDTEVHTLLLARYSPAKGKKAEQIEPIFRIAARLMDANSKQHLALLQVEPNAIGSLSEAFLVPVWARAQLIKRLPERHRTVVAFGTYHHSSRRLVATGFNTFPVGPREGKKASAIENSSVRLPVMDPEAPLPLELQTPVVQKATPTSAQAKTQTSAAKPPKPPADAPAHPQTPAPAQQSAKPKRLRAPNP